VASGSISTLLVRPVVATILSVADAERALQEFYRATGLTPELVADGDARITPAQFCIAWAELVRLTRDPSIALKMAQSTPPGAFGIVEYLCRSAPTLGEALRQWVRYLNILDDAVEVALVEEGDVAAVRVTAESEAPAPASHELCFAMLHAQATAISTVPFRATRVDFTHPATESVDAYGRFFDAPVHFRAAETQLVIARPLLDAKLVSADPTLFGILARAANDEQRKQAAEGQEKVLTAQVKRTLQKALREGASEVDDVAKRLGLSGRSLQRRLKDEGTSFQELREETRRDLARHYLDLDLAISEISFLLGFSEPSAFFRAFKRWTGLTPLESRAQRGHSIGAGGHGATRTVDPSFSS
jgi:AraC-like DNA-binding protein